MGNVVDLLGWGGQSFAEQSLGWNRCTIRKGQAEFQSGQVIEERFEQRGRRRAEERLPNLLNAIRSIVEPSGQTDPTFRSIRIYSPLSAEEVRLRLISQCGYNDAELPCTRTLRTKLNDLGYRLRKVRKCRPLKKIPETDAIFEEVHRVNQAADQDEGVLRISLDTKATVKVGPFSRGGYSRQGEMPVITTSSPRRRSPRSASCCRKPETIICGSVTARSLPTSWWIGLRKWCRGGSGLLTSTPW